MLQIANVNLDYMMIKLALIVFNVQINAALVVNQRIIVKFVKEIE